MRKKIKMLTTGIVTLLIILAVVIAALVVKMMDLKDADTKIIDYEYELDANQQTVYVASKDISAGDVLTEGENLMKQTVFTGIGTEYYITEEDLGSTAIVDIKQETPIYVSMVTPITIAKDTREYEIQVCNLMVDQKENDYVDIRIEFPDGGDYLVLPKKQIKNLNLENCVFWTYMNEEEILRFSSAVVDAFSVTGTKIYATRYVETNLQEDAMPTYLVNSTVQDMMDASSSYYDGNLLTKATQTLNAIARQNMEAKLSGLSEEKLAAVAAGHEIEDTARNSVLVGVGQYDYEEEKDNLFNGEGMEGTPTEESTTETEEETTEEESSTEDSAFSIKN